MEDAEYANESHYSKHNPALPLYNSLDAERVFPLLKNVALDQWVTIIPNRAEIRLSNSGHILGSTLIELRIEGKVIGFSGDLGREHPILLHPRASFEQVDTLVMECTYGDRQHSQEDPKEKLEHIINRTIKRGGTILIPAFAIGRTQELLFLLKQLRDEKRIPQDVPIYLDSPMAHLATEVFDQFRGWHTLAENDIKNLSHLFHHVGSSAESFSLCQSKRPAIIIAGSGMLNGGRIKHHLLNRISDPKHELILVGYQASGTPGKFLQNHTEELKLFGKYYPVKIQISELQSLSAHADQKELINWVQSFKKKPSKIFLVHGESHAAEGMRVRLSDTFNIPIEIAKMYKKASLF